MLTSPPHVIYISMVTMPISFMRRIREPGSLTIEQGIVSESSSAPFIFSPLVVTGEKTFLLLHSNIPRADKWMRLDDDDCLDTPSSSLGEIRLVVYHTSIPDKKGRIKGRKELHDSKPAVPNLQKVHESKKIGIGHRVRYVAILTLYICITH